MRAAWTSIAVSPPRFVAAQATFASRRAAHDADALLDGIARSIVALVQHIDDLANADPIRLSTLALAWREGARRWTARAKPFGPRGATIRQNASLALLAASELDQLVARRGTDGEPALDDPHPPAPPGVGRTRDSAAS